MYYIVVKKTYHFDSYHGYHFYIEAKKRSETHEHFINVLPTIFIDQLRQKDIEYKAYEPIRRHIGIVYDITYELVTIQEIDQAQADTMKASRAAVEQAHADFLADEAAKRIAYWEAQEEAKAKRKFNRWYRRLGRWAIGDPSVYVGK